MLQQVRDQVAEELLRAAADHAVHAVVVPLDQPVLMAHQGEMVPMVTTAKLVRMVALLRHKRRLLLRQGNAAVKVVVQEMPVLQVPKVPLARPVRLELMELPERMQPAPAERHKANLVQTANLVQKVHLEMTEQPLAADTYPRDHQDPLAQMEHPEHRVVLAQPAERVPTEKQEMRVPLAALVVLARTVLQVVQEPRVLVADLVIAAIALQLDWLRAIKNGQQQRQITVTTANPWNMVIESKF